MQPLTQSPHFPLSCYSTYQSTLPRRPPRRHADLTPHPSLPFLTLAASDPKPRRPFSRAFTRVAPPIRGFGQFVQRRGLSTLLRHGLVRTWGGGGRGDEILGLRLEKGATREGTVGCGGRLGGNWRLLLVSKAWENKWRQPHKGTRGGLSIEGISDRWFIIEGPC